MNDHAPRDPRDLSFSGDAPPERFAAPGPRWRTPRPPTLDDASGTTQRFSLWQRLRVRLAARALVLGAVLLLVVGAVGLYYAFREEPVFPLEAVILEGPTRLTADEALGLSGIAKGTNLLTVDASAAERAARAIADALPFAKKVTVERELPRSLRIHIEERTPTLLVAAQHLYLADEEGALYRRLQPGDKRALPVMTGLSRDDLQRRKPESRETIRGAIALVRMLNGRCTEHVRYGEARGYSALLCNGPEVYFGRPPFHPEQLSRLDRALGTAKRARVIHLDDVQRPERIVVRTGGKGA